MSLEKFCLKWNDFEKNISSAFRDIREEKDFFDVTVACDDGQLEAHKVILCACSPFFKQILRRNKHQHPLIYLRGVSFKEAEAVLNFMYHGEVNVAQDELNSFLQVAEDLKVKGLTQNPSTNTHDPKPGATVRNSDYDPTWPQETKHQSTTHEKRTKIPLQLEDVEVVEPNIKSEPQDTAHRHNGDHQEQTTAMYDVNHHQQDSVMELYDEGNGYEEEFEDQGFERSLGGQGGLDSTGAGRDQCPICLKKMLKNNIGKHIRMKHSEEEQSECPECGKIFKTTYNMKEHLRRFHGLSQRNVY